MSDVHRIEVPIRGMDCADCAAQVHREIASIPGVTRIEVLLSSEKAIVHSGTGQVSVESVEQAIKRAGYEPASVPAAAEQEPVSAGLSRKLFLALGLVFGTVLAVVVVGETLGLLDRITDRVPWPIWLTLILTGGYPIFQNVVRSLLRRRIIAQTMMTVGMMAAIAVGQWATALIIVFFMRLAAYVEEFTTSRARSAVRDLTRIAPMTGRVLRDGQEHILPVDQIHPGDIVVVRPGDQVPVDGVIVSGHATINQATITGESMPAEVGEGSQVFAATFAQLGAIRVRTQKTGSDTTFGKVIRMVEEAEGHRGDIQRMADRFSGFYLPVVMGIAALTFLLSRDALATAAVLVVACSCSFALATPVAIIASVGSAAKRGLVIKGGRYLESLARADVLLIDKTGTLTTGRPQITGCIPFNGLREDELLQIAAAAEHDSEHPLAEAVRNAAKARGLPVQQPEEFDAIPGFGVRASLDGRIVTVGNQRLLGDHEMPGIARSLQDEGKTLLFVEIDGHLAGVLAAEDSVRREVPDAIEQLREMGIGPIMLLTGDHEAAGASLAARLGIDYRAELLPEDKIEIVREFQARGFNVVMIGDGVNDAPAIAQADVGIAMGVAGTPVAIEAAHISLMRDDWLLVPDIFRTARRTMGVVKGNLGFTVAYNVLGLSLAAFGFLPPAIAAAAQAIPDVGILGNSSRLLRYRPPVSQAGTSTAGEGARADEHTIGQTGT